MAIKITCISKDNGRHYDPHEAIYRFGWVEDGTTAVKYSTLPEMIAFVKGGGEAYVKDRYSTKIAYLEVRRSSAGNEYVRTIPDSRMTDNLLSLGECRVL